MIIINIILLVLWVKTLNMDGQFIMYSMKSKNSTVFFLPGFFYVKTSNFFPFRGNWFYDADLVDYGVESGIITKDDILLQYKSSYSLEPKHFEKFVLSVFEKFQEPKKALNSLFGLFGHDFSNSNSHYFTTECKYAMLGVILCCPFLRVGARGYIVLSIPKGRG
jgi:hypothetical protein